MATFVTRLGSRYRELGGIVRVGTRVGRVTGKAGAFVVETSRGPMGAAQVVSALPLEIAARVAPPEVGSALRPYLERDRHRRGGALVAFLGVPEDQVSASAWTHHQILEDLRAPLGNGNNAFVSVSSPGDEASAPAGFRAVIISTHCELSPWTRLGESGYGVQKAEAFAGLLRVARRVYPRIAETYVVGELGTPTTYARYTGRPDGAVGGACLHLGNANQHAVPHEVGVRGFYLTGDGTWPGLGTVAACLASRDVARRVFHAHARSVGADAGRRRTWSAMKDSETAPCG